MWMEWKKMLGRESKASRISVMESLWSVQNSKQSDLTGCGLRGEVRREERVQSS